MASGHSVPGSDAELAFMPHLLIQSEYLPMVAG
jgi:hypothetical protein